VTEVILYHVPWYSIPAVMFVGWGLSVLFRWLRRNA
jgi:hypothetical protein